MIRFFHKRSRKRLHKNKGLISFHMKEEWSILTFIVSLFLEISLIYT